MPFLKAPESFLKKSQKKIGELRKKLNDLTTREHEEEAEDRAFLKKKREPEIMVALSTESVFRSALAILGLVAVVYLLQYMKDIIIVFLVALFLAAAFNPSVDKLERKGVPRGLGIVIMYTMVLGVLILMITLLVPIIAEQITSLALSVRDMIQNLVSTESAPDSWFMSKIHPLVNQVWQNVDQTEIIGTLTNTLKDVGSRLTSFAGNAIGAIFSVFNGILNLILVLMVTFFMVLNRSESSSFFRSLFPRRYSAYITLKTEQISYRIGEWIRGQVFLALAMGVLTFTIFSVIGLNYALTLSLISAIAEFIPYLGPFITFISAALIAVNQDPVLVLWLMPAYGVIQFIESNIMAPLIIGKTVGLNPVVILFALLAGATLGSQLGGSMGLALVGMIVSVPVANIISIFVEDYTVKNK